MPSLQPIDRVPDQADPTLVGAWLNKYTNGAQDYSSNEFDGTIVGSPVVGGDEGVGMHFEPGTDFVRTGTGIGNLLGTTTQLTFTCWLKMDNTNVNDGVFYIGSFGGLFGEAALVVLSNTIRMMLDQGVFAESVLFLGDDLGWNCFVMVYDGVDGKLYKNGSVIIDEPYTQNLELTGHSTNLAEYFTNVGTYSLDGQMKDARLYSEAKSADWVAYEFSLGVPDDSLRLWLPDGTQDYSRFRRSLTLSGGVIVGNGMEHNGVDGKADCGDLGNIQTVDFWVSPNSDTEELLLIDAGKDIMVDSGVITYTGLTEVATYVNGQPTTTLVAGFKQHVVCVMTQVDANNFETANDGVNFGQIDMDSLRAFDDPKTAAWANSEYKRMR